MKARKAILRAVALSSFFILPSVFGQGALTPPGAPAPMMKTLAQIEPRTPIASAPFTISQPGSYYLTTNLTVTGGNAIVIATNGVTLDLKGFTLKSTEATPAGYAIYLNSGLRNLTIQNGFIEGGVTNNGSGVYSGSGFLHGIYTSGNDPVNTRVSGITVTGCRGTGIRVSLVDPTVVENCMVRTVGGTGINADVIKSCSATDCGSSGINGNQVSDSHGESTTSGVGISAANAQNCYGDSISGVGLSADNAQNCYGSSSSSYGFIADNAQNCYGYSGSGVGLFAYNTASGSYGYSNSGDGLDANTAQNCYGYSGGSGVGLNVAYTANGCWGFSSSGTGLFAYNASFCTGARTGGTAIHATIATGCIAYTGTNNITYKYNMP